MAKDGTIQVFYCWFKKKFPLGLPSLAGLASHGKGFAKGIW